MIPDKGQMSQFEWRPHTTHHDDCGCLRRDLEKKLEIAKGAIQKAVMRLGAPTMDYEPAIAVREYKDSIEEATRTLLNALTKIRGGDA